MALSCGTTIVILAAIRLDTILQGPVRPRSHVGVGGTAIKNCFAKAGGEDLANTHRAQANVVVRARSVGHIRPLNFSSMIRCIVSTDNQAASPLRQAEGEDGCLHMAVVCEELLHDATGTPAKTEDAVCLLGVEEIVLVLVASHPGRHRRVVLEHVPDSN